MKNIVKRRNTFVFLLLGLIVAYFFIIPDTLRFRDAEGQTVFTIKYPAKYIADYSDFDKQDVTIERWNAYAEDYVIGIELVMFSPATPGLERFYTMKEQGAYTLRTYNGYEFYEVQESFPGFSLADGRVSETVFTTKKYIRFYGNRLLIINPYALSSGRKEKYIRIRDMRKILDSIVFSEAYSQADK